MPSARASTAILTPAGPAPTMIISYISDPKSLNDKLWFSFLMIESVNINVVDADINEAFMVSTQGVKRTRATKHASILGSDFASVVNSLTAMRADQARARVTGSIPLV